MANVKENRLKWSQRVPYKKTIFGTGITVYPCWLNQVVLWVFYDNLIMGHSHPCVVKWLDKEGFYVLINQSCTDVVSFGEKPALGPFKSFSAAFLALRMYA